MAQLRKLIEEIDRPTEVLKEFPDILSSLWNKTPQEEYTYENMHHFFTYTGEDLSLEVMIGMSCVPTIFNVKFKEKVFADKIFAFRPANLRTKVEKLKKELRG